MTISYESLVNTLFERMPMGVAIFDPSGRFVRLNDQFFEFASWFGEEPTEGDWVGRTVADIFPATVSFAREVGDKVFRAGETLRLDRLRLTKGSATAFWDVAFSPVFEDGNIVGVIEIVNDVTERETIHEELEERVEERTRELERRNDVAEGLRYILDTLNSCCPEEQVLDFIIGEARRLLGSDAISIYRLHVDGGVVTMEVQRGIEDEAVAQLEIPIMNEGWIANTIMKRKPMVMPSVEPLIETSARMMSPEQQAALYALLGHYKAILAVPLIVNDTVFGGLTMYYPEPREFTPEEVSLAEDLADHLALALENARLRESAEEAAASEERSRLARDLHDAVTQTLFSASIIAEVLPQLWERNPDEGRSRLAQLRDLTRGALAEMRTLLLELRPATLDEVPITDLFRQLAEATHGRSGIDVDVQIESECELEPDAKVAFYRIGQEALNNVAKHSRASRATLELAQDEGIVRLVVSDDGRGFDTDGKGPESFGLDIMRERAESVGALLSVESVPGNGTRISVHWRGRCEEKL